VSKLDERYIKHLYADPDLFRIFLFTFGNITKASKGGGSMDTGPSYRSYMLFVLKILYTILPTT
jgi:hypothetical protein